MAFEEVREVSRFDLLAGREHHAVAGTIVYCELIWLRREVIVVLFAVVLGNLVHVEFVEHVRTISDVRVAHLVSLAWPWGAHEVYGVTLLPIFGGSD